MQDKNAPKIYPIDKLPKFIQGAVGKLWEEAGGGPKVTSHIVFTYFDGIYAKDPLSTDLYVHECVHFVRQGSGQDEKLAKEWWSRYVSEKDFRYQEEVLAYKEQYAFILRHTKNRAEAFEHAKRLAKDLSGPIYGNLASYPKALNDIIGT